MRKPVDGRVRLRVTWRLGKERSMQVMTRATSPSSVRDRILDAAIVAFYRDGIRAVSADKLIAEVGTTKVTFYRHFRSKDDLVVAYLQFMAEGERAAVEAALSDDGGSASSMLDRLADLIGEQSCSPGFRGCPFINAAAEYPDPESPVRVLVAAHRAWLHGAFEAGVAAHGAADPAAIADQLLMIRDGAMVAGYLSDPTRVRAALAGAARSILGG
jgi:AcrR family transcriptional regulator